MTVKSKRKWGWSSKNLLASVSTNKALKLDYPIINNQDGTVDQINTNDFSLDGCSLEDSHYTIGLAARMRRSGSKFLSVVGLQRNGSNDSLAWAVNALLTKDRDWVSQKDIKQGQRAGHCSCYRQRCCSLFNLHKFAN